MKTKIRFTVLAILAVAAGVVSLGAARTPAPQYSLEVDFGAMADQPDAYQCQAVFRDLATDEVLTAPKVAFLAGQPAKTESKIPGSDRTAVLTASVDETTRLLEYTLEVREAQRVVSRHRATVHLE